MSPELSIILINFIVLLIAYLHVNPKYAKNDFKKISLQDLIGSMVSLLIVGSVYYGSEQPFSLLFMDVNWIWFTLATYTVIETPFFLWYAKRYNVRLPK